MKEPAYVQNFIVILNIDENCKITFNDTLDGVEWVWRCASHSSIAMYVIKSHGLL